jgi:hypothetical protein
MFKYLLSLAFLAMILPGTSQATGQIATVNPDGSVTVTDLSTGLSFVQSPGYAANFGYGGYGTGLTVAPSITFSRFNRFSTFGPFVAPAPVVVGSPFFFSQRAFVGRNAVFVDRFGRVRFR